jgi:hypothetical protein
MVRSVKAKDGLNNLTGGAKQKWGVSLMAKPRPPKPHSMVRFLHSLPN